MFGGLQVVGVCIATLHPVSASALENKLILNPQPRLIAAKRNSLKQSMLETKGMAFGHKDATNNRLRNGF